MEFIAMNFSIRARLTICFTAIFGMIVVVLAIGAYLLTRSDLNSKLDAALQVEVDVTAIAANHELTENAQQQLGDADIQFVLNGQSDTPLPDTQILVRQGQRNVAYKRGKANTVDIRSMPLDRIKSGETYQGMRVIMRELNVSEFHTAYKIYSAESTRYTWARLLKVERALALFVPLGLAFAACAGYLVASRLLAPLKELTDAIAGITSAGLSLRVRVSGRNDEIGRLAASFNSLLDRLEQAFIVQRRFMADASHELRTPITVALTATQASLRDPARTQADCEEALSIVEDQMQGLRRIVADMLFLSHADASTLKVSAEDMYLDDAVAEASRAAQMLARAKHQTLVVKSLPEARCKGDQDLLRQAILVLLDNAVKFTPDGGVIEIGIRHRKGNWVCSVADSGIGIPEEAEGRIFERFFRALQPTGSRVPGAGLGLSIAQSIIERHGGQLSLVTSRPGFTEFEIVICAVPSDEEALPEPQANSFAVRM